MITLRPANRGERVLLADSQTRRHTLNHADAPDAVQRTRRRDRWVCPKRQDSAYRPAFGMVKAYTLLLPMPGAMLRYPEPQYTLPSTIDGASMTEPPLAKVNRTAPVRASIACIAPEY